jgi:hypothetical protein
MTEDEKKTSRQMVAIIKSIDLGTPVAEHDAILFEARIETTAFSDLFGDQVDLIPGTKGSGKTALFRIVSEFLQPLLLKTGVIPLTGVEASGDPVFQSFKGKFEALTDMEFENFWRVYFISLIQERFVKNDNYREFVKDASAEIEEFRKRCHAAHIPELNRARTLSEIVAGVLHSIKVSICNTKADESGPSYSLVEIEPTEPDSGNNLPKRKDEGPIFLKDIHDSLIALLKKSNVKIWIMLDRLDEVFQRRTKLERMALRALLRTTRNFPTPLIRIKIFLRDDIFDNILNGEDGFTALTHIESRKAQTLRWKPIEIQLLIVKRFSLNERVQRLYRITKSLIQQNDHAYANQVFYSLFPNQVVKGKSQSNTLDWICHHCQDGQGVVAPRDVIDLLEFALKSQAEYLQRGLEIKTDKDTNLPELIGSLALKEGLSELSKKKCRTYLKAEFPEFWKDIKRFENSKAEHAQKSLYRLLGVKWKDKVEDLVSLGFLQHRPRSTNYIIPFIFRAGMGIRQGKAQ